MYIKIDYVLCIVPSASEDNYFQKHLVLAMLPAR